MPAKASKKALATTAATPTARNSLREAVERWFFREPLLFSVWMTHRLEMTTALATIRVSQGRIECNPAFIDSLTTLELNEVMRVEALRILLKHPYLRRPEEPEAALLASNITVQEHWPVALPLPTAASIFGPGKMDKQHFELYYALLPRTASDPPSATSEPSSATSQESEPQRSQSLDAWADAAASARENTQGWDDDGLMTETINDLIRDTQSSGRWGNTPRELQGLILASLKPKVDYRGLLRRFRASIVCSRTYTTRMSPSRRYGLPFPGKRRERAARLLFAVDVSGSVSNAELKLGFSIINRFFRHAVPIIDVVQFDCELKLPVESLTKARMSYEIVGRGGTSFQPIIDYLDEIPTTYDGLIIFTDGEAPKPTRPKRSRTRIHWLYTRDLTSGFLSEVNF